MKKKVLIGLFLSGILLIGIGAGVALGEYSSFSYGGEVIIGQGGTAVETQICHIPVGERKTGIYNYTGKEPQFVEDKTLQDGQVRVEVMYHSKYAVPFIHLEKEYFDENSQESTMIYISSGRKISDFALFMEFKDDMLQSLKNHVIKNYYLDPVESVTIKANETTLNHIQY